MLAYKQTLFLDRAGYPTTQDIFSDTLTLHEEGVQVLYREEIEEQRPTADDPRVWRTPRDEVFTGEHQEQTANRVYNAIDDAYDLASRALDESLREDQEPGLIVLQVTEE